MSEFPYYLTQVADECSGCGNPPDLCVCEELDHYGDDTESANTPPDYLYPER